MTASRNVFLLAFLCLSLLGAIALARPQATSTQPAILNEVMFPRANAEVWAATQKLMSELRFEADTVDVEHQLFVTRFRPYSGLPLPQPSAIGVPPEAEPSWVQVHLYVAPQMQPARVSIGSVVYTTLRVSTEAKSRRLAPTIYGASALHVWFLQQLSKRLGATPELMGSDTATRAEQSRRLMPSGLSDKCATDPSSFGPLDPKIVKPMAKLFFSYQAVYPGREYLERRGDVVHIEAEITEHGTVVNAKATKGGAQFRPAAEAASALFRFEPAQVGGCPVAMRGTFEMAFRVR